MRQPRLEQIQNSWQVQDTMYRCTLVPMYFASPTSSYLRESRVSKQAPRAPYDDPRAGPNLTQSTLNLPRGLGLPRGAQLRTSISDQSRASPSEYGRSGSRCIPAEIAVGSGVLGLGLPVFSGRIPPEGTAEGVRSILDQRHCRGFIPRI